MRFRTIKRRMRLTLLPDKAIQELYLAMKGVPDELVDVLHSPANQVWVAEIKKVLKKYPPPKILLGSPIGHVTS